MNFMNEFMYECYCKKRIYISYLGFGRTICLYNNIENGRFATGLVIDYQKKIVAKNRIKINSICHLFI